MPSEAYMTAVILLVSGKIWRDDTLDRPDAQPPPLLLKRAPEAYRLLILFQPAGLQGGFFRRFRHERETIDGIIYYLLAHTVINRRAYMAGLTPLHTSTKMQDIMMIYYRRAIC